MRMRIVPFLGKIWIAFVLATLVGATAVQAANDKGEKKDEKPAETKAIEKQPDSTTDGTVTVNGQVITYKAIAGTLTVGATDPQDANIGLDGKVLPDIGEKAPDKPEDAPATARIFYTAYFKTPVAGVNRPVTFLYNGGPGSATMWLHMGAFGPRRVVTTDTEHDAAAPYKIVNNDSSLLDVSDLVFIDAPGTGFSRVFGKNKFESFYGLDQDAHAFERFIRRFLTKYDKWNAPKYLFGESYGTPRSAVVSSDLQGVDLNGIILLSAILGFDNDIDLPKLNPGIDQGYAIGLPTYAATAWYHKKLPNQPPALEPFLAEVESYAMGEYMSALLQGSELPQARKEAVAAKLHEYTGLTVDYLLKSDLRVTGGAFRKTLQDAEGLTTGRLDSRYKGPDFDRLSEEAEYDPQDLALSSAFTTAINSYLRTDLKYGQNWTYKPGADDGFQWLWRKNFWAGQNVMADLATTMKSNPKTKILLAGGYYDLATPFYEGMFEMHHLPIPHSLQANISYKYYQAGHMIYVNDAILKQFHQDVAAFIQSTESPK